MSSVLKIENVSKSFSLEDEESIEILKNISFEVNESEFFGIMGESGAGKSTLLNVISSIDEADHGEVFFSGKKLSQLKETELDQLRNNDIGFVYQSHHLLAEFDVLENVLMPIYIKKFSKAKKEDAIRLLERVGLGKRIHHSVKKLSGGEQQRVSIARALINSPKLIFCDEPTGNLDEQNSLQVFSLFKELSEEFRISFVVVSHSMLLKDFANRIIYLKDGKIEN